MSGWVDFLTLISFLRNQKYAIIAMNEYTMNNKYHLYLVVKKVSGNTSFKAEGDCYGKVFASIIKQVSQFKEKDEDE